MKHLMPDIMTMLKTDFHIMFDDPRQKQDHKAQGSMTLKKIENDFFYTHKERNGADQEKWAEACLVRSDVSWPELIRLFKVHEIVFIEAGDIIIGYLNRADSLMAVFQSYQYLQAYFGAVLLTTDDALSLIDDEEKMVVWTEAAETIFSISKEEIIGKPATDFFAAEMLQSLKTLRTGEVVRRRQHQPREDKFVLINSNPVVLNDKIIGAVAAETDITSQIRLHQEIIHLSNEVHHLQNKVADLSPSENPFNKIIGSSPEMEHCIDLVKKISSTNVTVLITGESGVGKELFAKAIHDNSKERQGPFIAINCGAIPSALFESELFGYESGAFSGANPKGSKGKFELAAGGTLFLDEIGEMPLDMQVKLLRVIQEKSFYRVGGSKTFSATCRIITATNRNLEEMITDGKFREDLYYRLNILNLEIPPLRKRKEDVYDLVKAFIQEFSISYKKPVQHFPHDVFQALLNYDWPGNVRELRNTVERLIIFSTDGQLKIEHLPNPIKERYGNEQPYKQGDSSTPFQDRLDEYEKNLLLHELKQANGNKNSLAKDLGISRATLYYKMKRLGI